MGANAVFCTSGRKPRCSAFTRRLLKRVALGLSDSASGCDIGVPTSVTVFSRSGAGPEALALTLLRIGLFIERAPDRASSREIDARPGNQKVKPVRASLSVLMHLAMSCPGMRLAGEEVVFNMYALRFIISLFFWQLMQLYNVGILCFLTSPIRRAIHSKLRQRTVR